MTPRYQSVFFIISIGEFRFIFTESDPLGWFSHRFAMVVCDSVVLWFCAVFFPEASHWPSGHMISVRPLISPTPRAQNALWISVRATPFCAEFFLKKLSKWSRFLLRFIVPSFYQSVIIVFVQVNLTITDFKSFVIFFVLNSNKKITGRWQSFGWQAPNIIKSLQVIRSRFWYSLLNGFHSCIFGHKSGPKGSLMKKEAKIFWGSTIDTKTKVICADLLDFACDWLFRTFLDFVTFQFW